MPITIYLESGEVLNLNLQPSASEEEVINFDILDLVTSTVASSMTLESNVSQVSELDEFVVSVKLNNVTDIYAEEFTLGFDSNKVEYIDAEVSDSDKYEIVHENANASSVNFIVASNGEGNGIHGSDILIEVTFKMKDVLGTTTISIDNASIADGDGTISTLIHIINIQI